MMTSPVANASRCCARRSIRVRLPHVYQVQIHRVRFTTSASHLSAVVDDDDLELVPYFRLKVLASRR